MRLVKSRKEGRMVYYALDDEHIRDLFCGDWSTLNISNVVREETDGPRTTFELQFIKGKRMTEKLQLHITGMDCADCAVKLEKGVANLAESKLAGLILLPPKWKLPRQERSNRDY
jgi:hypothetical protein